MTECLVSSKALVWSVVQVKVLLGLVNGRRGAAVVDILGVNSVKIHHIRESKKFLNGMHLLPAVLIM